jgi:hypothetical protein
LFFSQDTMVHRMETSSSYDPFLLHIEEKSNDHQRDNQTEGDHQKHDQKGIADSYCYSEDQETREYKQPNKLLFRFIHRALRPFI